MRAWDQNIVYFKRISILILQAHYGCMNGNQECILKIPTMLALQKGLKPGRKLTNLVYIQCIGFHLQTEIVQEGSNSDQIIVGYSCSIGAQILCLRCLVETIQQVPKILMKFYLNMQPIQTIR